MTDASSDKQIATWIRADDSRPFCARPWQQITVLSDGSAVCACVDAAKTNPLGNFRFQTFDEVWNGKSYEKLRRAIASDIDQTPICVGCPNRIAEPPPADYFTGVQKPEALFIESYAGCNLACPGCDRESIEGNRDELAMSLDAFKRVIDGVSPTLKYMEFHLGGENYMHKDAHEMVTYARKNNPNCFILSSTNGHFFHTEERCQKVLDSGIDALIFSVDGARQETYEKYRVNGRFDRVFEAMKKIVAMRNAQGLRRPIVIWRYILFEWNDSREEMDLARRLAEEIGVDHLAWHLNAVSIMQSSKRYHIGSPHLMEIKDEIWDTLPERLADGPKDVKFDRYR
ncbi:MAG: radical SAM protein [Planctomycetes bacterium]|nr:radical SAM protein [Planctomycetota bacterium]